MLQPPKIFVDINQKRVGGFNHFLLIFIPKFGEDEPILTNILFQMGWFNHQPVNEALSMSSE